MKNILIVGAGIVNKPHAAGITVRSIFDGIDPKHVMGLDWRESASGKEKYAPIKIRKLNYSILSPARILDNSHLKKASHTIKKAEVGNVSDIEKKKQINSLSKTIKYLRQWIALVPARSRIRVGKKTMGEIKRFNPQVIYTVGESVASLRLAYNLSKSLEIPIVIHFMDNWKHCIEWADNPLLKRYQRKLTHWCNLCYTRTTECIAIGERMAEAYEKETGIKHTVIMNSIDTTKYKCEPRNDDGVVHFIYAGGLHLGRDKALRLIGECIDHISEEKGIKVDLSIYTSLDNIDLFRGQFDKLLNTHLIPAVSHDKVLCLYQNADVLVHVESGALNGNEFFKYSVSTKVSEYLATGRTFLFYGPADIYLHDFLRRKNLAYTVSNKDEMDKTMMKLVERKENIYAHNAIEYAINNFDLSIARHRFCDVIDHVKLPHIDN